MVSIKQFAILGLALGSPIAVASPGDIEKRSSEVNPDALLKREEDPCAGELLIYDDGDCIRAVHSAE